MTVTPQTLDQIRKMPSGVDRIEAIANYIKSGEDKIRQARDIRDSDVRDLVQKLGPTKVSKQTGLTIHTVKSISRGTKMSKAISYTESFDLNQSFALDDLGMTLDQDERLRVALRDHPESGYIQQEIEEKITEQIREHGVNTETGEWLGEWSATDIVTQVLDSHEGARS